ncbi:MAG: sulfatase family protein [Candidatus Helarchaeota archaeon]
MRNPNIFFIILDSFRSDKCFYKFQNKELTPFLSKILNKSIYFKNCIAPSPWTLPSHASFFTGLYPSLHKCISPFSKLDNKIPTLAEILKNHGYYTICYSENTLINEQYRLTKGFDIVIPVWKKLVGNKKTNKLDNFLIKNSYKRIYNILIKKLLDISNIFGLTNLQKYIKIIDFKLKNLVQFLLAYYFWRNKKNKNNTFIDIKKFKEILNNIQTEKPLFIFFNIMATHDPFFTPREILKYFNINRKDFWNIKDCLYYANYANKKYNYKREKFTKKKVKSIEKFYNACVYYADRIVEIIFDILKSANVLDDAYIIITSDHGEHLGEHNLIGHMTRISIFEEHIKVPLIIYNQNFKKQIIKDQVELINLFHTILDISKINFKEKIFNRSKSLLQQLKGNSFPEFIYGEYLENTEFIRDFVKNYGHLIKPYIIPKLLCNKKFLRTSRFKMIKYKNSFEFYDLINDKSEKYNIYNENDPKCIELKTKMNEIENKINNLIILKEYKTIREKERIKHALKHLNF